MKNEKETYLSTIREHYLPLLEKHGYSHNAVDWSSSDSQKIRFQILLEVGIWQNSSILDIGCGVGHLVDYLVKQQYKGLYTGIDSLPEMISEAKQKHPKHRFIHCDADDNNLVADYVLGSGLFTFSNKKHMRQIIRSMYVASNVAVAFNSLSEWADHVNADEYHADPLDVIRFCRTLTPRVVLRHDYHPGDFTVYLYKNNN